MKQVERQQLAELLKYSLIVVATLAGADHLSVRAALFRARDAGRLGERLIDMHGIEGADAIERGDVHVQRKGDSTYAYKQKGSDSS